MSEPIHFLYKKWTLPSFLRVYKATLYKQLSSLCGGMSVGLRWRSEIREHPSFTDKKPWVIFMSCNNQKLHSLQWGYQPSHIWYYEAVKRQYHILVYSMERWLYLLRYHSLWNLLDLFFFHIVCREAEYRKTYSFTF